MVGSTALWPTLLATWLNLTPVPSSMPAAGTPVPPPPAIGLPARRD